MPNATDANASNPLAAKIDLSYTSLRKSQTNKVVLSGLKTFLRASKWMLISPLCPRLFRRLGLEVTAISLPKAPDVNITKSTINGVKCRHFTPLSASSNTVKMLYVHGGGYEIGSSHSHASISSQYASKGGFTVTAVDYSMDGYNALRDLKKCYLALIAEDARDIVIVGDSAGGGLALNLVHEILQEPKLRQPRCVGLLSAVTDLNVKAASMQDNTAIDPIISARWLSQGIKYFYRQGVKLGLKETQAQFKQRLSAIHHDYNNCPPVYIQASTDEILLDDSLAIAHKLDQQGVAVLLDLYQDLFHGFQLYPIADSHMANQRMVDFINATPYRGIL